MNRKIIFSLILLVFGEALIITGFMQFGKSLHENILKLNILVTSLIYFLLFIDLLLPWIDLSDKTQKQIGSIGLRWFFTFVYILLAIGVMVYFNNLRPASFQFQLLIHSSIFFFLCLGLFFSFSASDKVSEVYFEEKKNRDHIEDIKKITKDLQLKVEQTKNVNPEILSRINNLLEDIRYLSPCNNDIAYDLEKKYIDEIKNIKDRFLDTSLNVEVLKEDLRNCERTLKERKQIFSN